MKIRWKLFVALMLVVASGTVGTLVVAEREFREWVRLQVKESFERHVEMVIESREQRLKEVREQSRRLARNEVVLRALRSQREEVSAEDRDVMRLAYAEELRLERSDGESGRERQRDGRADAPSRSGMPLPLMGVLTKDDDLVLISSHRLLLNQRRKRLAGSWSKPGAYLKDLERENVQVVGYGLLDDRSKGARVKEVVVTPVHLDGSWAGWFFLGRDAESQEERVLSRFGVRNSWTGVWVEGEWFADAVDPGLQTKVEALVTPELLEIQEPEVFEWNDERYVLVSQVLNPDSPLGQGAQVAVFSLGRLDEAVGELRWGVLWLGVGALLISAAVAWWLSRRFSDPILRLVEATRRVSEGDLGWQVPVRGKDEFAVLAGDFNRMTKDLSLKEKYRDLLGKTSDPSVADRLMEGTIQLGGEVRRAAVVFCDIRGFTAMTDGMAPAEVIDMLNDHMTAMTRVIHEHGGVVDKFVGDLVMAVFGAPISRDDDALRAAACATAMIRTRQRMNAATDAPVEIGIGLAAGEVVSGLMGSVDRLNYTVLGDRVNLAARLCSRAASGEVLVDGETASLLPEDLRAEPHGSVEVKGFRSAVEIWALRIDRA